MPSDADCAAMAYARGNRDPATVELVERTIREEQEYSRKTPSWLRDGGHIHSRCCHDDAGPGAGGVSLICGKIEGADPRD